MNHVLWSDLLDGPQISGIVGTEELMSGPEFPAVKAPFMGAHEVLTGQDRMLLVPDNRLAHIQVVSLQDGRVIGNIRVAAENIKPSARQQYPGHVPEPRL